MREMRCRPPSLQVRRRDSLGDKRSERQVGLASPLPDLWFRDGSIVPGGYYTAVHMILLYYATNMTGLLAIGDNTHLLMRDALETAHAALHFLDELFALPVLHLPVLHLPATMSCSARVYQHYATEL